MKDLIGQALFYLEKEIFEQLSANQTLKKPGTQLTKNQTLRHPDRFFD